MLLTYLNQICLGTLKDFAENFDCTIDTVAYSIRNQTQVQWKHNGLDVFLQKRATKLTAGARTMNHYINMQRPLFSMCSQIEHFQDNKAICKNSHNSG